MRIRNVNPVGAVYDALVGREIGRGEEFDVPDEDGALLLLQVGNYEPADTPPTEPPAPPVEETPAPTENGAPA